MLNLQPMTSQEFNWFKNYTITTYAQNKIHLKEWLISNAFHQAKQAFELLAPQGLRTSNHYFLTLTLSASSQKIGSLWFAINRQKSILFLYDIYILPTFQRKGHATQVFTNLENYASELALNHIQLHVFGNNQAALSLYQKLGFVCTHQTLSKCVLKI